LRRGSERDEDQLEVSDEFKEKVARAKQEIAATRSPAGFRRVKAALQIYSRDFDADFFKLPPVLQEPESNPALTVSAARSKRTRIIA
jgi:hypothetical protein